ncbi:hypothetical protein B9Z55_016511 [Caenorhabditis nigoni]|uniref:7TM GPCR serpentine receptor class x (Srx) domain-containing protein n=1 Tax=Caenorhabditis nigoni TaxID=1611254 RepID=A0A2G5T5T0_9PELO|nr:hypothetical protein B9Z55_016511 [Caenorhabditis nigoni]
MEITVKLFLHLIQYAGFLFGQITNATLLFLVLTRAEKLFGSYRNVMAAFASYSLGYTWIEVLAQPVMHIKGSMFIVMMDGPIKMEVWMGNLLGSLYCGSTALCISLLTAQFYYRYVALCKEVMAENYGVDLFNESFIGPMYYSYDENGARILRWVDIIASVGCSCMMTMLPLVMLYIPIGTFITLPFFEIGLGRVGNYCGAAAGLYPAMEPLIAIFFIKDFRETVLCKGKRSVYVHHSQTRSSDIFSSTSFH